MSEALISRFDSVKKFDSASLMPHGLVHDGLLTRLKRIESILRNGLPTDDKAEASTITHAHSEAEKALEDIFPGWWAK